MRDLLSLIRWMLLGRFRSKASLEAEILALRHQLNVLRRTSPRRPVFSNFDRMIFVCLYRIAPRILDAITIVEPETVIRWHRAGFRSFWRWKSSRRAGRPSVPPEIRRLIREMSLANPLWGAPRIHGELLKLGIDVGQTSVAKYMARRRRPPSQGWRTFLLNHADGIASIDLFVVPTISFKLLYGLLILRHDRRRIVWLGVTRSPTANGSRDKSARLAGGSRCRITSFVIATVSTARHLARRLRAMGIRDRPTAPRSPWQNGYAERLIGSIRRECLDHVIVLGERHLRHVLGAYQQYYNGTRTHLALAKNSPLTRSVQTIGRILPLPILGGYTIVTSGSDLRQGQVEGHSHVYEGMVWENVYVGSYDRRDPDCKVWSGVGTVDALVHRLREFEARLGSADEALTGWGFDPLFVDRPLTATDLDRVSMTRPVLVYHASFHIINANTVVMQRQH